MSLASRWSRLTVLVLLFGLVGAASVVARSDAPQPYQMVSSIPSIMDGQPLRTFMFDRTSNRLFAGNTVGLYSSDLSVATPKVTGPLARGIMTAIDVAPDLGRVFYAAVDEIGFVSERGGPPVKISSRNAWDLVYEPTRHEVYVAFEHAAQVLVFDATTGDQRATIDLPGWNAFELEAVPGRVFMMLGGKDGLYSIDAATHKIASWEVKGSFITPGDLQADPSGRYLFMARSGEIDEVDIATHAVVGRVAMFGTPSIGFDADSHVLIAAWPDLTRIGQRLVVLQPSPNGLTLLATLKNESTGRSRVVRTNRGFLQIADLRYLVWSATRAASTR
jgi:hypothetical protein